MRWDLFCRVVDNWGDVGFAWRLAADLGSRGEIVRLWLDDRSALGWMAPAGAPGVTVGSWADAARLERSGDVVVEAFGCGLPDAFSAAMAQRRPRPLWIDVEYLSAEAYVERNHGLPSPRASGPAAGMTQWYFYPGFVAGTGGLLREPELIARQQRFSAAAWLRSTIGIDLQAEGVGCTASVFCYSVPDPTRGLAPRFPRPLRLLLAAGPSAEAAEQAMAQRGGDGSITQSIRLPRLEQAEYDHLLWSCDLNMVRGEDSFVRAQWAGRPFVWQPYPQLGGAHRAKLDAFLDRFLEDAPAALARSIRGVFGAWNGLVESAEWPQMTEWQRHCRRWRKRLLAQKDLTGNLLEFVAARVLK